MKTLLPLILAAIAGLSAGDAPHVPATGPEARTTAQRAENAADRAPTSLRAPRDIERAAAAPQAASPPTGPFDAKQLETIVAVAADVSPEWGAELKQRIDRDPDGAARAIEANGQRLLALAVLREQNPELYRLKVEELRLQLEMRSLSRQYQDAMRKGDRDRAASARASLERVVRSHIDLDLRTRAEELAALDQHVRSLKEELARDTSRRSERIGELMHELTDGSTPAGNRLSTSNRRKPDDDGSKATSDE